MVVSFPPRLRSRSNKLPRECGFTLIELMVSMGVLVMLGGLILQLMGSASRLTSTSKKAGDCDTEARFTLDQIAADMAHRVRRPDVDAFVGKLAGDDLLFFFSETPGYSPVLTATNRSNVSLVGYRLKQVPAAFGTNFQLQRYSRALPWEKLGTTETPMSFVALTGSGASAKPVPATTLAGTDGKGGGGTFPKVLTQDASEDIYYQVIGDNVVRFEVSLLRKPDLTNPAAPVAARLLKDNEIPSELALNGWTNIASIIITLAVIDSQSASKVTPAQIQALSLSDTDTSSLKYPLEDWNKTFAAKISSLTPQLKTGLRLYQRVISL